MKSYYSENLMSIHIREASSADFDTIQKLNHALFVSEHTNYNTSLNCDWPTSQIGTEYFKKSIADDTSLTIIAKKDDEDIGYLIGTIRERATHTRTIGKTAELDNMFIIEGERNQETGSALAEYFLSWAKARDVKNICVTAETKNTKAIDFYKKHDFDSYTNTLEISL